MFTSLHLASLCVLKFSFIYNFHQFSIARAGSDVVAPSDMMDGRVGAIRDALDSVNTYIQYLYLM
jgi:delta-aminolevulinic acid dehydratase/porphobilinogen synthase